MIGSLMSRMATAEKLSVAQLQKAIKDGTLPAYVGIPLLQDKMKQQKDAQASAQGQQPQQPPIAEQVMQEAAASEMPQQAPMMAGAPQGIDTAPSNLPAQGMAGGGIVAFANGDLVDDDEEDDSLEEARQLAEVQSLFDSAAGRLGRSLSEGQGAGITGAYGMNPEGRSGSGMNPESKGGMGFKEKIEHLESRGRDFDKEGKILTSPKGAKGKMQTMDATVRAPGFGVAPAKDNSLEERNRVGRDYADALKDYYKGNEKIAAMAYNWGPGNVDKWLASGMKGPVPGETRQYAANFAQGGEVKHFAEAGLVERANQFLGFGDTEEPASEFGRDIKRLRKYAAEPGINEALIEKARGVGEYFKPSSPKPTKQVWSTFDAASKAFEQEQATKNLPPAGPLTQGTPPTGSGIDSAITKEPSFEDKYMSLLKGREENTTKQRSVDNYMALLQAGLGMMGGTSPYTAVNIGQGASSGVAAKLASEKNRIAEEAATMKGYGNLYSTQQNAKLREMLAGQNTEAKIGQQIGLRERQLENLAKDTVLKTGLLADSAEAQAKIAKEVERLKSGDEYLKKLYTQYGLPPIGTSAAPQPDLVSRAQERLKNRGY